MDPITRAQTIATARRFLGWGWRHQGRGPAHVDCVGLPILVAWKLGIRPPDFDVTGYSRTANLQRLVAAFQAEMTEKAVTQALPGDLVVTRDRILPCHCGILGEKSYGLSLIHARASVGRQRTKGLQGRGQVREDAYEPEWRARATHCFSFPGVID